ncbi:unnamed protein product [Pleuronectes platessa]|uniref:Uncharacterized protein n=1 Tax=Pleuronectes platessa TaxID=8262 RepID=A0A9N7YQA7_PLEPL|nr:unnamed protein product [Pleuronectes platessa]
MFQLEFTDISSSSTGVRETDSPEVNQDGGRMWRHPTGMQGAVQESGSGAHILFGVSVRALLVTERLHPDSGKDQRFVVKQIPRDSRLPRRNPCLTTSDTPLNARQQAGSQFIHSTPRLR